MRALPWLFALLLAAGCAAVKDPLGHRDALKDTQKRYTDMIRWREAERAAKFVEPDAREEFLANAGELELLEISDYELGEIEYYDDEKSAKIEVTYRGYSLAYLIERKIRVTQEWHRNEENNWMVQPELEAIVAQLQGTTP